MIETFGEAIDDRDHSIAVGDRKCAAWTEIILDVDYQQQIVVTDPGLHFEPAFELIFRTLTQRRHSSSRDLLTADLGHGYLAPGECPGQSKSETTNLLLVMATAQPKVTWKPTSNAPRYQGRRDGAPHHPSAGLLTSPRKPLVARRAAG
jgi:hypothetical protein